jgi:pyridoxal phosphate enzyme (YggS family)
MLADNLAMVQNKIKEALAKRTELKVTGDAVTIVAVTKNHPAEIVTEALNAGLKNVGENRVQEAQHKKAILPAGGIWHLIGHLQKNKAKHAVELFDIIESVDSTEILDRIDKLAEEANKIQDVLLQINEAREPQKSGLSPEDFVALTGKLAAYSHVRVRGVMVIAQATDNVEETRPVFAAGYRDFLALEKIVGKETCNILSMGMTHDYWIAVEEGANEVRVGTALFGARDYSQKF